MVIFRVKALSDMEGCSLGHDKEKNVKIRDSNCIFIYLKNTISVNRAFIYQEYYEI